MVSESDREEMVLSFTVSTLKQKIQEETVILILQSEFLCKTRTIFLNRLSSARFYICPKPHFHVPADSREISNVFKEKYLLKYHIRYTKSRTAFLQFSGTLNKQGFWRQFKMSFLRLTYEDTVSMFSQPSTKNAFIITLLLQRAD